MRLRSRAASVLAVLLALALVVPPDIAAQVAAAGQQAGQISRMVPAVNIERGGKQMKAAMQTAVLWQDVVATTAHGRARISLDDGSVLNVGSDSKLKVVQHDSGVQQTELELAYGRVRSQAVRVARPGSKFEVRTPVGVAGVVGTDFYLAYLNGILELLVYEGQVNFCNLAGQCVSVLAGFIAFIRGANLAPDAPTQATPSQLTDAGQNSDVPDSQARQARPPQGMNGWAIFFMIVAIAAPAIAVPLARRGNGKRPVDQCPSGSQFCGE